MAVIGHIREIWRYPVKSMAGEHVLSARLDAAGLDGDRQYAFESSSAPPGMLRVSGAERRALLGYSASLGDAGRVMVHCPDGEFVAVDAVTQRLEQGHGARFTLTRKDAPQTDVRPLSLLGQASVEALGTESGEALDARRFRANFLCTFTAGAFAEDSLCGNTLCLGAEARVRILERIPRCRFVTYAPEAPLEQPPRFALMKLLDRRHQGRAGVYAAVVTPGRVGRGDLISTEDGSSAQ